MLNIIVGNQKDLATYIQQNQRNLYLWGAGVILQICISMFVAENGIEDRIYACTDGDSQKWGKEIIISRCRKVVLSPNEFISKFQQDKKAFLVITCSYFTDILKELDNKPEFDNRDCVIMPMIYSEYPISDNFSIVTDDKCKIPKLIHYCWFGNNKIPTKELQCIETLEEKCPDYKIICWNERNIDQVESPWLRYAFQNHKWALASDYVRAMVLYKYGGIYFDTDVELTRNIDDFLKLTAFGSMENWPVLNTGGGCGSIPKFWLWKEIMEIRDQAACNQKHAIFPMASGYYDTIPLMKRGLKSDAYIQDIDGFTVLPCEVFHPYNYVNGSLRKMENTYGIHHFNWSWANEQMKAGSSDKIYSQILMRTKKIL